MLIRVVWLSLINPRRVRSEYWEVCRIAATGLSFWDRSGTGDDDNGDQIKAIE